MAQDLPPVPHSAKIANSNGLITPVWSDWFKKIFNRVGGHDASTNDELYTVSTARISDGAVTFVKLLSTDWSSSRVASGYQKLGSGLYLQWGVTGILSSGSVNTISFPIAFPTACLLVIAGFKDNSGSATTETGTCGTGNYSTTSFDLYNRTSGAHVFNWIAIGH